MYQYERVYVSHEKDTSTERLNELAEKGYRLVPGLFVPAANPSGAGYLYVEREKPEETHVERFNRARTEAKAERARADRPPMPEGTQAPPGEPPSY